MSTHYSDVRMDTSASTLKGQVCSFLDEATQRLHMQAKLGSEIADQVREPMTASVDCWGKLPKYYQTCLPCQDYRSKPEQFANGIRGFVNRVKEKSEMWKGIGSYTFVSSVVWMCRTMLPDLSYVDVSARIQVP